MNTKSEDFEPVDDQLALLLRGTVDCVTEPELRKKLERSRSTGKPLTVKVGFDPTAPDLHLGHTVLLRKMQQFQELGHRVVFVIGDFTGRIGDPTGRSKTRPPLTDEEIAANAETYKRQCFTILIPERTEVRMNSEWLEPLGAAGLIRLAARYNLARMLERNDFHERHTSGKSIALHELFYPLAQAYDSVALEADVELGGTDQLFNLNVGRDIMPSYGLEPQVLLTTPLLEGLDGHDKMSKSLGNYVGITEPPREIYGKLLSVSDELMWRYYELCTDLSAEGIAELRRLVADGTLHPKRAKEGLALRIVSDFHDEAAARDAREEFERVFAKHEQPDEIEERRIPAGTGKVDLLQLLVTLGHATSRSDAQRLLKQGAVHIGGSRVPDNQREIEAVPGQRSIVKVGKRRFTGVTFE